MDVPPDGRPRVERVWVHPDPVKVLRDWLEVVGPHLARVASPRGFESRRLVIAVPDEPWDKEITNLVEEILPRLRAKEGWQALRGIKTVVDASEVQAPRPREAPRPPPPETAPPEDIALAARAIPDPSIADRWVRAVARLLLRTRDAGTL